MNIKKYYDYIDRIYDGLYYACNNHEFFEYTATNVKKQGHPCFMQQTNVGNPCYGNLTKKQITKEFNTHVDVYLRLFETPEDWIESLDFNGNTITWFINTSPIITFDTLKERLAFLYPQLKGLCNADFTYSLTKLETPKIWYKEWCSRPIAIPVNVQLSYDFYNANSHQIFFIMDMMRRAFMMSKMTTWTLTEKLTKDFDVDFIKASILLDVMDNASPADSIFHEASSKTDFRTFKTTDYDFSDSDMMHAPHIFSKVKSSNLEFLPTDDIYMVRRRFSEIYDKYYKTFDLDCWKPYYSKIIDLLQLDLINNK